MPPSCSDSPCRPRPAPLGDGRHSRDDRGGLMKLEDKVAVVSGAGRGLGRASALRFAREGAKVVAVDIYEKNVNETAKMITEEGGVAVPVVADVREEREVKAAIETAAAQFGALDILFA